MYMIMDGLEHLLRDIMEHLTAEIKIIREMTEVGQEDLSAAMCKPKKLKAVMCTKEGKCRPDKKR
jgi:hypothetical protein